MERTLVQSLACPCCGSSLTSHTAELERSGCALSYPVCDGIPALLISAASGSTTESPDPTFETLLTAVVEEPLSGRELSLVAKRCTTTPDDGPPLIDAYEQHLADSSFDLVLASRSAFSQLEGRVCDRAGASRPSTTG